MPTHEEKHSFVGLSFGGNYLVFNGSFRRGPGGWWTFERLSRVARLSQLKPVPVIRLIELK